MNAWHYESDGEIGARTHYAVRDADDAPCGTERVDFRTAKEARAFVANANFLIFRLLNSAEAT